MKTIIFKIEDAENFSKYEKCLPSVSPERREKASRMKGSAKTIAVLSEYLLKRELIALLGRDRDIEIKRTASGKPYIEGGEIFFSVSHSKNFIALAIAKTPVGVDIEAVKPVNLRVAERFFAPGEREAVFSAESPNEEFLKIWTAKEAYVKLTGTGITDGFSDFSVFDEEIKKILKTEVFEDFVLSVAGEERDIKIEGRMMRYEKN